MKRGTITKAAEAAGLPIYSVSDYATGRKNAGPERADLMASLTGTDIRLWLLGGPGVREARRAALSAWAGEPAGKGGP